MVTGVKASKAGSLPRSGVVLLAQRLASSSSSVAALRPIHLVTGGLHLGREADQHRTASRTPSGLPTPPRRRTMLADRLR